MIGRSGWDPRLIPVEELAAFDFAFVTLTAPSFGKIKRGAGVPVDPASYDYAGTVTWNYGSGRLLARTMERLSERYGLRYRVPVGSKPKDTRPLFGNVQEVTLPHRTRRLRVEYFAAWEFQVRGALHVHLILRASNGGGVSDIRTRQTTYPERLQGAPAGQLLTFMQGVEVAPPAEIWPAPTTMQTWGKQGTLAWISPADMDRGSAGEGFDLEQFSRVTYYLSKLVGYQTKSIFETPSLGATAEKAAHCRALDAAARAMFIPNVPDPLRLGTRPEGKPLAGLDHGDKPLPRAAGAWGARSRPLSQSRGWSLMGLTRKRQREVRQEFVQQRQAELELVDAITGEIDGDVPAPVVTEAATEHARAVTEFIRTAPPGWEQSTAWGKVAFDLLMGRVPPTWPSDLPRWLPEAA